VHERKGGTLMSTETTARSVRQADGLDPVRALQRVLYRSAKQDPKRRFHALYDKLARSDVMWRAWVDVCTNGGAPGVDGVTIGSIEATEVALASVKHGRPGRNWATRYNGVWLRCLGVCALTGTVRSRPTHALR
jgi:hypothetical protein